MTKFIAHRGNISGRQEDLENNPTYIQLALNLGYDVEVDCWFIDGDFVLGHDEPMFSVRKSFLTNQKIWCHAKNVEALDQLLTPYACHVFCHDKDPMAITSHGFIWHYPTNHEFNHRSVCVLPEIGIQNDKILKICYGICSDEVGKYKADYESFQPKYFK